MQSKNGAQNKFRVLLIGSSGKQAIYVGVGKSSLLLKYINNTFSYDYQVTTGVEFHSQSVRVNDKTQVLLQIWDTVGQETFRAIVRNFYKGVSAILLIYSIQSHSSFEQLADWMREINENAHKDVVIYLVGCKLDLEDIRKVPRRKADEYAKSIGAAGLTEVSAKTGENIKEVPIPRPQLFQKLARTLNKKFATCQGFRDLVDPVLTEEPSSKSQSVRLSNRGGERKESLMSTSSWGCC